METKEVPFSIEDYQKLVVEDQTHELTVENLRDGSTASIITTDCGNITYPILAMLGPPGEGSPVLFTKEGRSKYLANNLILKPKPPKVVAWVNIYGVEGKADYYWHSSRDDADRSYSPGRTGVLEITDQQFAEAIARYSPK